MPTRFTIEEESITKALEAMDNDPTLKGTVAAAKFSAPYQRLMARRRGRPASSTRGGHNTKLSEPADKALKDYLLMLFHAGTSANMEVVQESAGRLLLFATGDVNAAVSRRWTKRWMTRNTTYLKTLKTRPISAKRLATHIVEDIRSHFKEFTRCKEKWGIQDEDISNFDETGFQIGVMPGEQVIVPVDCMSVYVTDPDNKELVTSVETINWGGQKIPPMIIFKGAYHIRKHFDNDMNPNTLWARSPTGFSNDRLGMVYLEHFKSLHRIPLKADIAC